jgi:FkbM family methyltransferase
MEIKYGIRENYMDVTNICLNKLNQNNIITIPAGDYKRADFFTDPLIGVEKYIFIKLKDITYIYDANFEIYINLDTNTVTNLYASDIFNKTNLLHSKIKLKYGNLNEELPEQKMSIMYLNGSEKILEIGGNIGRNSLIISSILKDSGNLVTLESDEIISKQLEENKVLNNFNFHIENSALSKRKLIQSGWDTIPSDTLIDGYKWVNTITYDELKQKYSINFDTLVLDCEGAFYYILMDMPEILNNINLIIMENDYKILSHKQYIDSILKENNFYRDYCEEGGWGPCYKNFFEVWKRNNLI